MNLGYFPRYDIPLALTLALREHDDTYVDVTGRIHGRKWVMSGRVNLVPWRLKPYLHYSVLHNNNAIRGLLLRLAYYGYDHVTDTDTAASQ